MKKALAITMAAVMAMGLTACGSKGTEAPASAAPTEATNTTQASADTGGETKAEESKTEEAKAEGGNYHIIWVSCSTESEFWQYQEIGMKNAVKDMQDKYGITINFETVGPANESETESYIRAFENAIASKPQAIISATQVPDATIAVSKEATDQGIVVNFTNCGLEIYGSHEHDDVYNQFYTTISADIGELAGQILLERLEAAGIEPKGVVGMHFSNINEALQPRMDNLKSYLAEHAPEIEVLDTLYHTNDLAAAQGNVENQISTYGSKLIGLYGANNISGDGIALAIQNAGIGDKVVAIGVDSDALEIEALEEGNLDVIIVQEAYGQGYAALKNAVETLVEGSNPETEKHVLLDPVAITSENMKEDKYAALLDPTILAK